MRLEFYRFPIPIPIRGLRLKFADCNNRDWKEFSIGIQFVVVSCLRAPWGAPHPAWRTAKGLLRPPYVFPRRSHRDGEREPAEPPVRVQINLQALFLRITRLVFSL